MTGSDKDYYKEYKRRRHEEIWWHLFRFLITVAILVECIIFIFYFILFAFYSIHYALSCNYFDVPVDIL